MPTPTARPAPKGHGRLAAVCNEAFTFVLAMQRLRDPGEMAALRARITGILDKLSAAAADAGVDSQDVNLAKYALVALFDEIVLRSHWDFREEWAGSPLQLALFDEFSAGEGFYDRLEQVRARRDAGADDVLEVFALCLGVGFRGKYATVAGQEQVQVLMREVEQRLAQARGTDGRLSGHAARDEVLQDKVQGTPNWVFAAACGGALLGLFLLFELVLWLSLPAFPPVPGGAS